MTTLISFIGKARENKAEGRRYLKTKYKFPDGKSLETTFFGSALANWLKEDIDNALFIGTTGSTWSELIELLKEEEQEDLFEIADNLDRSQENLEELLREFGEKLSEKLHYNVFLIPVSNSPQNAEEIKDRILKVFHSFERMPEKVIFDITHAYRYMPYVALLTLIPLRYLGIKDINIYYGFLEFNDQGEGKPVIELKILKELIELTENLSIFHNTGNFSELSSILFKDHKDLFNRTYFKIEINQRPRKDIKRISELPTQDLFSEQLLKEIKSLNEEEKLEDRLVKRAKFFFERRQYLKTITPLNEAILKKGGKDKWEDLIDSLRDQSLVETFQKFRKLRNAVVHGNDKVSGQYAGYVKEVLESEEKFKSFIAEVFKAYERLEVK